MAARAMLSTPGCEGRGFESFGFGEEALRQVPGRPAARSRVYNV